MSRAFYPKLAASNIRKNSPLYLPYILCCTFTVAMFYMLLFITLNKGITKISGSEYITTLMVMGAIVIGIFSVIILLYTNSFLMKRRGKELGLYNILGMGKHHIARVISLETLYTAILSILLGLGLGMLLSKLMLALLLKLLHFPVAFGFEISPMALGITALLFAGIFLVTLLLNLGRIRLSKPIELLYEGNVGEKEPKTKWLLALIGLLSLGSGYTIALTIVNPLSALRLFFLAVLLVILGTYCLFTAGSIVLLKALRKNKSYYYKTSHFTTVSGMLYRMKQNAVGLASICILSTMVLVMLSSTVSLYVGLEDALRARYPRNIEVTLANATAENWSTAKKTVTKTLGNSGAVTSNLMQYRYTSCGAVRNGTTFSPLRSTDGTDYTCYFMPLSDYNTFQGASETLGPGEVLLYTPQHSLESTTVTLGGRTYQVKAVLKAFTFENYYMATPQAYFVLPDEDTIRQVKSTLCGSEQSWTGFTYYYGFDVVSGFSQKALAEQLSGVLTTALSAAAPSSDLSIDVDSAEANRDMFLNLYGGLFFLGIFLGAMFIMATVVIMYYKQYSEGHEDKKRFEIMQKVGLSREEIKKAIRSQVLTVFFLPLATAGVHIAASFKMITRLLYLLNLTNVPLFVKSTLGCFAVFALIYAAVYLLTARSYYKIVS